MADVLGEKALRAVRGDGVYFFNDANQRYLDWNSQAMCVNQGHTPDATIVEAITTQLEELPYMYPSDSSVPIRAKVGALLADLVPGSINTYIPVYVIWQRSKRSGHAYRPYLHGS